MVILFVPIVLLVFLYLERLIYAKFWNRGLTAVLSFQKSPVTEGDTATLTEVVMNKKRLPLPILQVNFQLGRGLVVMDTENVTVTDKTNMTELFSLRSWQRVTRELTLDCRKRGYYRILRTSLIAGDMFTSHTSYMNTDQSTELYVYPRMIARTQIEVPFSYLMGEVRSRQLLYEDVFTFRGIRDYVPTDALSHVNWKASARTGELKVNLREYTSGQQVMILLNVEEPSIHYLPVVLEDAIRYALTLSAQLLEEHIPVGMLSNGQDIVTGASLKLEAGSSPGHLRMFCECLSRIDLERKEEEFAAFLARELPKEQEGNQSNITYVLVSPSRRKPTMEASIRLAKRQQRLLWICPVTAGENIQYPSSESGIILYAAIHGK